MRLIGREKKGRKVMVKGGLVNSLAGFCENFEDSDDIQKEGGKDSEM